VVLVLVLLLRDEQQHCSDGVLKTLLLHMHNFKLLNCEKHSNSNSGSSSSIELTVVAAVASAIEVCGHQ
jgi:hypothetical protein